MGHLNGFCPGEIGNVNNSFQKSQMLALIGGGGVGGGGVEPSIWLIHWGMYIRMFPGIPKQGSWLDRVKEQLYLARKSEGIAMDDCIE